MRRRWRRPPLNVHRFGHQSTEQGITCGMTEKIPCGASYAGGIKRADGRGSHSSASGSQSGGGNGPTCSIVPPKIKRAIRSAIGDKGAQKKKATAGRQQHVFKTSVEHRGKVEIADGDITATNHAGSRGHRRRRVVRERALMAAPGARPILRIVNVMFVQAPERQKPMSE